VDSVTVRVVQGIGVAACWRAADRPPTSRCGVCGEDGFWKSPAGRPPATAARRRSITDSSGGRPVGAEEHPRAPGLFGLALLSPALVAIIYGLYRAGTADGLRDPAVVAPLAVGLALLAAFTGHALRARTTPLLDLRLFAGRPFAVAAALNFLSRMSIFGATILMPLYYQQARGQTALAAGLLLAPQSVGTMLALPVVGRLTDRLGARPVVVTGIVLTALGTLAYTRVGLDTSELLLAAALVHLGPRDRRRHRAGDGSRLSRTAPRGGSPRGRHPHHRPDGGSVVRRRHAHDGPATPHHRPHPHRALPSTAPRSRPPSATPSGGLSPSPLSSSGTQEQAGYR
jgi:Major Facilitator Superfamily